MQLFSCNAIYIAVSQNKNKINVANNFRKINDHLFLDIGGWGNLTPPPLHKKEDKWDFIDN